MTKRIVAACTLLALAGCEHIKYTTNAAPGAAPADEKWHHNFALGLVELNQVDLQKECPGGQFAAVDHQIGLFPSLIIAGSQVVGAIGAFFIVGGVVALLPAVWQPTTYKVTCASGDATPGGGQVPPPPSGIPSS